MALDPIADALREAQREGRSVSSWSSSAARRRPGPKPKPLRARLLSKVNVDDKGCWLWTGCIHKNGYGAIGLPGKPWRKHLAHRVAYELFRGPIPAGLELDHRCRVLRCINPSHLEVVTASENTRRSLSPAGINSRKSHCIHGHPFDETNTYVTSEGKRQCRKCRRARGRRKVAA
jgi:hypothetical protein